MAITPAGAQVNQSVSKQWKKIFKKNIQPQTDKRYYTKKKTRQKFVNKKKSAAGDAAAQAGATAAANAATDVKLGGYYTKAEADGKYAAAPKVVRGVYTMRYTADAAGENGGSPISFGIALAAAPTVHMILQGAVPPAECPGTAEAPSATPGHLCVFQGFSLNSTNNSIFDITGSPGASRMGAYVSASSAGVGVTRDVGSWALGVSTLSPGQKAGQGSGPMKLGPDAQK